MNSWLPGMLDAVLQATFLCALLMFWLCIYHGLRQNERRFVSFYLVKIIVVLPIWLCAIVLATWEKCNELRDPTYSHFVDTKNYNVSAVGLPIYYPILIWSVLQGLKMFFYIACCMYVLYLGLLLLRAYTELRSMPYFGKFLFILIFVSWIFCSDRVFVLLISLVFSACFYSIFFSLLLCSFLLLPFLAFSS